MMTMKNNGFVKEYAIGRKTSLTWTMRSSGRQLRRRRQGRIWLTT